jgi:hypothetical protein
MKMQQTKSYRRVVAAVGVVSALMASACVVTSSDDSAGGDGGETNATAGSTNAGGASAGSSSTAGSGAQAADYQCDTGDGGAPPGTAADCTSAPAQVPDACASCLQTQCCTELGECYATTPGNQCGYGGPNDGGEFTCFQKCAQDGFTANSVDDDDLRTTCSNQCTTSTDHQSSHDCGLIGTQTNALIACLSDNCLTQCIGG